MDHVRHDPRRCIVEKSRCCFRVSGGYEVHLMRSQRPGPPGCHLLKYCWIGDVESRTPSGFMPLTREQHQNVDETGLFHEGSGISRSNGVERRLPPILHPWRYRRRHLDCSTTSSLKKAATLQQYFNKTLFLPVQYLWVGPTSPFPT